MEQKITQQSGNRAVYEAPEVEVIEIKPQGILCASGSNEDYTNNTPDWFGSL